MKSFMSGMRKNSQEGAGENENCNRRRNPTSENQTPAEKKLALEPREMSPNLRESPAANLPADDHQQQRSSSDREAARFRDRDRVETHQVLHQNRIMRN